MKITIFDLFTLQETVVVEGSRFGIVLESGQEFDIAERKEDEGQITVSSDRSLIICPAVSNVIRIGLK